MGRDKYLKKLAPLSSQVVKEGLIKSLHTCIVLLTQPTHNNNGNQRMSINSTTINKITIKYSFPIPPLNGMLAKMVKPYITLKINQRSGNHQIEIKGKWSHRLLLIHLTNANRTLMRLMTNFGPDGHPKARILMWNIECIDQWIK